GELPLAVDGGLYDHEIHTARHAFAAVIDQGPRHSDREVSTRRGILGRAWRSVRRLAGEDSSSRFEDEETVHVEDGDLEFGARVRVEGNARDAVGIPNGVVLEDYAASAR